MSIEGFISHSLLHLFVVLIISVLVVSVAVWLNWKHKWWMASKTLELTHADARVLDTDAQVDKVFVNLEFTIGVERMAASIGAKVRSGDAANFGNILEKKREVNEFDIKREVYNDKHLFLDDMIEPPEESDEYHEPEREYPNPEMFAPRNPRSQFMYTDPEVDSNDLYWEFTFKNARWDCKISLLQDNIQRAIEKVVCHIWNAEAVSVEMERRPECVILKVPAKFNDFVALLSSMNFKK